MNDHFSWLDDHEPAAKLVFDDPPRQKVIDVGKFIESHGGQEIWGSAFLVAPNTDPNLFRSLDFRQLCLLPTDKRPWDKNLYCLKDSLDCYAVISFLAWRRYRRLGQLNFAEDQASIGMEAVTEGLVHYLGTQWGKYLRDSEVSIPCGWPDVDERTKLGISGHGFKRNNSYIRFPKPPDIPIDDMPKNAKEFHRSWITLSEKFRDALWMHFVPIATTKEKAEALGISLHAYQFLVEDSIEAMRKSMISLLITTMEARQLVGADKPLDNNHVRTLQALCSHAEGKMKPRSPIVFRGNSNNGYIVCETHFKNLEGAGYVHRLLMQATNNIEISNMIPAVELETWGGIGKGGEFLSATEPGVFPNEDADVADIGYQNSDWSEDSRQELEIIRQERNALKAAGEKRETNPLLDFYEKRLNANRHLGNQKAWTADPGGKEPKNDPESARKRVQQSIDYFIKQLIECDDTRHVGLHFMDAVDTGIDCEYVGDWPFKLFSK